jgi:hypothetical protein
MSFEDTNHPLTNRTYAWDGNPCGYRGKDAPPYKQNCNDDCKRKAANLRRRPRDDALRSLGLTKTQFGWE